VGLALKHGVAIGAHPSLPDLAGFGRRAMQVTPAEAYELVLYQVGALSGFVRAAGGTLRHVKPHGALYNMAARDQKLAEIVVTAIRSVDPALTLFGLAGSALLTAAERLGLRGISETFADRGYRPDGSLQPRTEPGSVIHDAEAVADRAVAMVREGSVTAVDHSRVALRADTICLHGDTPGADALARRVRDAFAAAGIRVAAP